MKIIKSALILLVSLYSTSVFSQTFNAFGVKVGANYGESIINETFSQGGVDFNYATHEADVAVPWGIFTRFKVSKVVFQPEVLASNYKTKMKLSSPNYDSILTLKQNRFDIPLLFGYAPIKRFRLLTGPVYTKMLENNVGTNEFLFKEFKTVLNGGSWAWQLGFGFNIGKINIDCKYETSLGKLGDSVTIKGQEFKFDQRNNTVQVTLGLNFVTPR
ncbi:MAG: outer membrane beta-barrel protein [Flavobacteriales bacterium]|nr:outer membrane beta-barrel protein [Flavobacteriales bacterium]